MFYLLIILIHSFRSIFFILYCTHMSKFNHLYGQLDCFLILCNYIWRFNLQLFVYGILYIESWFSVQAPRSGTAPLKGKFIVHFIMGRLCFAPKMYKLHPFMKWVRVRTLYFWKNNVFLNFCSLWWQKLHAVCFISACYFLCSSRPHLFSMSYDWLD